jgi:hypothetical protein
MSNIADLNSNVYLGKTTTVPRPTVDNGRYFDAKHLDEHQRMWDAAEAWRAEAEQRNTDRLKKLQDDREAEATQRRAAERSDLEAELKRQFLAKPGALESDWTEDRKQRELDAYFDRQPSGIEQAKARLLRSGVYSNL